MLLVKRMVVFAKHFVKGEIDDYYWVWDNYLFLKI